MALYAPGASQRRTVKEPKTESGIRALERGLALLEGLNKSDGARPTALAISLGLPRSFVYRSLETLEELQYAEGSATDARFRFTDSVWLLACQNPAWLCGGSDHRTAGRPDRMPDRRLLL